MKISRRSFVRMAGIGGITTISSHYFNMPEGKNMEVNVLNPYDRVPVIDLPITGYLLPNTDYCKLRCQTPGAMPSANPCSDISFG